MLIVVDIEHRLESETSEKLEGAIILNILFQRPHQLALSFWKGRGKLPFPTHCRKHHVNRILTQTSCETPIFTAFCGGAVSKLIPAWPARYLENHVSRFHERKQDPHHCTATCSKLTDAAPLFKRNETNMRSRCL